MWKARFVTQVARSGVRSPLLENATKAMTLIAMKMVVLHLNGDNHYHSDDTPVVALSTGWYNKGSRCLNNITITANGRSVVAMVVMSVTQPWDVIATMIISLHVANNIVDASRAVWKALGVPQDQWGGLDITWTDA
ncbi:putative ripening-related protein 1 [Vitis vinifera]|uniref:Putative ripening-related protein 1 n=1 Tax=Vitis vinifera TaxID=29760 RepID=A0A438D5D5_VITVI|nr:putative ripening-related protein 1 [Vitis vinifera]